MGERAMSGSRTLGAVPVCGLTPCADRLDGMARYGLVHPLSDVEHLLFLLAEDVSIATLPAVPQRVTQCRAYHLTPAGEDRTARLWPAYAVALRDAGYTVHLRASVPDTLGDVTVIEANSATVESVIASLDDLPPATLVAIALAGGDADPVEDDTGTLGAPGTLLLRTPWTGADWVSEEVCDHTSLMQLCERWTAARGREAEARLTAWRRRVCGDLVTALDLGEEVEPSVLRTGTLARPLPYQPRADIAVDDSPDDMRVTLLLSNSGPEVTRAAHVVIHDGDKVTRDTVPASPMSRPKELSIPVGVVGGHYDVSVTGPNRFRRRYAGPVAVVGAGTRVAATLAIVEEPAGDPALELTLSNAGPGAVVFSIADRRTGHAHVQTVTVQEEHTETVRHEPWQADTGWYDLVVTTEAVPTWVQEYAGHLEGHRRTARTCPDREE